MRLIGSSQTIVTQGRSGATTSSSSSARSSTGSSIAPAMPSILPTGGEHSTEVGTDPHRLPAMSTALLTDHYELTMLRAALESGSADAPSVFEVFARSLPNGRRYGVVGGTGAFPDAAGGF